ncbi:Glucosamine-6-phosphate isomerase (Glucosamine-6-phosphate deaminase) (GNPDA) (GlcN6P deaminase) [Neurospora sp. IMI 360204]|nr:Glucosamine-6-phosphate isomerase (Glucosamine-6-phosphate deaminase) (GNPDA) (GlcN6P deaminase) [Neurospora sp. IMI 360204]
MGLIIRDNAESASSYIADYIVNRITSFSPTPTRPFVLGLPTGSSPLGIYKSLIDKYEAGLVSFENVITFNMDEYISLPPTHPQSYASYMHDNFFSHVNIPSQNINLLNGLAPDLAAECSRYESKIAAAGGIDLFLAGLGDDGHLAFNEPGSSLTSRTRVVTLAEDTIIANSRFFDDDVDKVPRMALTVGVKTVLEAKEVLMIVLGARKARALKKCVEEGVSCMWTGSALQMHERAIVVCDEKAAGELRWKTVKVRVSVSCLFRKSGQC